MVPRPGRQTGAVALAGAGTLFGLYGLLSAHPAVAADADATDLARSAPLVVIERIALARNPDLAEKQARVASARTRADLAGRLPDLQLKSELWGVPLARPLALREANSIMLGLSQTLPAPGTLGAQAGLAAEETASTAAGAAARRLELRAQVRRAYADYYRADRELGLHREHVQLTGRLVELARGSYRSGQRSQQDVLRLGLELSRLHRDLAHIEQERVSAQALLNALMGRPIEAPLAPPAELDPDLWAPGPEEAAGAGEDRRPELAAARAAVRREELAVELARRERHWPSLTVGADYMYMPLMSDPHAYGAMVMFNLPWLSLGKRDAVRAAEQSLHAERHALASVRNLLRFERRDARTRYDAARSTFAIVERDLLPQAQRNFEAASSSYAAGQGDAVGLVDALRSFLDVRLDRVRALVHLVSTAADLARVAGEEENRP